MSSLIFDPKRTPRPDIVPTPKPVTPTLTKHIKPAPTVTMPTPPVTPQSPKPITPPPIPSQPTYGGGTGQSGMGMGMDGGFKKGGSVKSYTDKSGRINLGSGRVTTHASNKKNSNW